MKKTIPGIKYVFYSFSLLFFISSCTLIPCFSDSGLDYVKENPNSEFLIGSYKLDKWTLNRTQGYENSQDAKLKINSDGTFELLEIRRGTIDLHTLYYSEGKNINATGYWKSNFHNGIAYLLVQFKFDSTKTDLEDFRTSWKIYKKDHKPVIFIMVGDPDECAAIRFEKISE